MRLNRFNLRRNTHYACRFNNMRSCLIFISTVPTIMDYLLISTRLLSLLEMSMVDLVAFWSNTLKQFFARIRTEIAPSIGDSSGTLNPIRAQSLLRGIFGGENCAFSAMLSTPDIVIRSSGPSVCLSVWLPVFVRSITQKTNDPKVFTLDIRNDLGISYLVMWFWAWKVKDQGYGQG